MDRASQVLARGVPPGVPKSYRALADHSAVPRGTPHHRARGRRSIEEKAQSQQYLTPLEEDVVVKFLLQMSDLGQPIRIKFIPSISFSVTRERPKADRLLKPLGKNWAKAFENRHLELQARRVKPLNWDRHEKNIYGKVIHWFEVIGKIYTSQRLLHRLSSHFSPFIRPSTYASPICSHLSSSRCFRNTIGALAPFSSAISSPIAAFPGTNAK
jgi:hypothetical protein